MSSITHSSTESVLRVVGDIRNQLKSQPSVPQLYIRLATLYANLGQFGAAVGALTEGLTRCEPNEDLYREAIFAVSEANRTEDAIRLLDRARQLFPDARHFQIWEALLLPVLYDSETEIEEYRARYTAGLDRIMRAFPLESEQDRRAAFDAVSRHLNFYLGYQGLNDRPLQELYGQFVHRVVAANYPQWARSRFAPPRAVGGRIRVGYISSHFRNHSVSKLFLGWLQERNRRDFEVFAYHTGNAVDAVTDKVRARVDHFQHLPGQFEEVCQAVVSDQLHIAVYPDARHRRLFMMANLRLAPIQCVAWAYPITSGSPMIDYYLSGDLMEPPNGQEHYCERLVRLPGIGVCYPKPVIPRPLLTKTRSDFGIGGERTVFLCSQSTCKYLPQHDDLFVRIAKRLPASQFVFLGLNDVVAEDFRQRLERTFRTERLEASEYCLILPRLSTLDYWNLNLVSDVFLDSLGWSGGVTALEAIACDLPVVTLPGSFMRSRHSYGILRQLGSTQTIAKDKADFVDISVRLGTDREWRAQVLQDMKSGHQRLYSDTKCVAALEDFYRAAVREAPIAQRA